MTWRSAWIRVNVCLLGTALLTHLPLRPTLTVGLVTVLALGCLVVRGKD